MGEAKVTERKLLIMKFGDLILRQFPKTKQKQTNTQTNLLAYPKARKKNVLPLVADPWSG